MAKRKTDTYWQKRVDAQERKKEALAHDLSKETRKSYQRQYKRLKTEIDALYSEILSNGGLEAITRTDLYNLTHWSKITKLLAVELGISAKEDEQNLTRLLTRVALNQFQVNLDLFNKEFNQLIVNEAEALVTQNWSGKLFSERIWDNSRAFNARVLEDIELCVTAGYPPDKLARQLMKDYSVKYHEADRLIRTETSHVFNKAGVESYKKGGCTKVEYFAEDDCCEDCEPYSGQVYEIGTEPHVPVHPNCRCTYLPVVDI